MSSDPQTPEEYRTAQGLDLDRIEPVWRRPVLHLEQRDRMPGPDGPATGIKVAECIRLARSWWDTVGRQSVHQSATRTLDPEQGGVASGILRGLEFDRLTRDEAERVVLIYNASIVIPTLSGLAPGETFELDRLAHRGKVGTVKA